MKIKIRTLLLAAVVLLTIAVGSLGVYHHFNRDLTGYTAEEIMRFKSENPNINVSYTVTIEGGEAPMVLKEDTTELTLTAPAQLESLAVHKEYFTLERVALDYISTEEQLLSAYTAFPDTELVYDAFSLNGTRYPFNSTEADLSGLDYERITALCPLLARLPALESIQLMREDGTSLLSVDEVLALQEALPTLLFRYSFELFGQTVTTDTDTLIYKNVSIGDSGLDSFRKIMPIMKKLTYLRLDTCDTSNEATAQLREDLAPQCKVVWRVFFGMNNALTDTYKIWASWVVSTEEAEHLRYCNEIKYLDMGHSHYKNLDFMEYMPDIEMAIVAIGLVEDLSGIKNCKKLEMLEVFSNVELTDEDMQNLAGLTNIKYLNISNLPNVRDLSFTDNMKDLRWLWCTMSSISKEEIERVQKLHPDCKIVHLSYGDPTDYGWRFTPESRSTKKSSLYLLVRARFGYEASDYSYGDSGYLREEITFESLGLTPP